MSEATDEKAAFISAIQADEYAEYELPNGDVLITDWEGDGEFYPYILPNNEADISDHGKRADETAELIQSALEDFTLVDIEATDPDPSGTVIYYPVIRLPKEVKYE